VRLALFALADGRKLRGDRKPEADTYHLIGGDAPPESVSEKTFLALVRLGVIARLADSTYYRPTYLITLAGVELARRLRS
jgi:hypothetical protein